MSKTLAHSSNDRHTNRLKAAGHRMIIEERFLSIEGVKERYPKVWEMINFHGLEVFTQPRDTYVPSMVREFYQALEAVIPKVRRELRTSELVDSVQVRGKMVSFNPLDINDELGCPNNPRMISKMSSKKICLF